MTCEIYSTVASSLSETQDAQQLVMCAKNEKIILAEQVQLLNYRNDSTSQRIEQILAEMDQKNQCSRGNDMQIHRLQTYFTDLNKRRQDLESYLADLRARVWFHCLASESFVVDILRRQGDDCLCRSFA